MHTYYIDIKALWLAVLDVLKAIRLSITSSGQDADSQLKILIIICLLTASETLSSHYFWLWFFFTVANTVNKVLCCRR